MSVWDLQGVVTSTPTVTVTDTHDRDQNLIGPMFGPWLLDHTVERALTLDCQHEVGGVWVESEDKTILTLIE